VGRDTSDFLGEVDGTERRMEGENGWIGWIGWDGREGSGSTGDETLLRGPSIYLIRLNRQIYKFHSFSSTGQFAA